MIVLGGGAFRMWLGHEGGAPMNGISALIKGAPESYFAFLPCEDTEKLAVCNPEEGPHQTSNLSAPWSWTSSNQNCDVCYSGPNRLRCSYCSANISRLIPWRWTWASLSLCLEHSRNSVNASQWQNESSQGKGSSKEIVRKWVDGRVFSAHLF